MPSERALAPALRLGDPLRRLFLDELRARVMLPRPLDGEWALARADLTLAVLEGEDGLDLMIAAGDLNGARRWTLRFALDGPDADELVTAIAAALDVVATMRPEQASIPRQLAAAIRAGRHPIVDDDQPWPEDEDEHEDEPEDEHDEDEEDEDDKDEEHEEHEEHESPLLPVTRASREFLAVTASERGRGRRGGRSGRVTRVLRATVATVLVAGGTAVVVLALVLGADDTTGSTGGEQPAPTAAAGAVPDYSIQLRNADGSPVRFDPCRGYDYVVQPGTTAPEEAAAEVGGAFAAIEEASGIAFRFAGFSDARFPHPIDPAQLPRLPILVSYERPDESTALTDNTSAHGGDATGPLGGLAVGTPVEARPGLTVVAGGAMILDETLAPDQRARILLHELGHLVGLGHASDPTQMMAPAVPEGGPASYREGDRAGLAELGAGSGCALTDAERTEVYGAEANS
ncbi:MAG: matrixin family metalloprotease [Actinobacteria bacterium]|nr:matrixin family metalloprotease [Actinomycetota bacterium]